MIAARRKSVGPPACRFPVIAIGLLRAAIGPAHAGPDARELLPIVRRIFVPADRERVWPAGNWQPVALEDFERQLEAARVADRGRPGTYLERAEYSATLV